MVHFSGKKSAHKKSRHFPKAASNQATIGLRVQRRSEVHIDQSSTAPDSLLEHARARHPQQPQKKVERNNQIQCFREKNGERPSVCCKTKEFSLIVVFFFEVVSQKIQSFEEKSTRSF